MIIRGFWHILLINHWYSIVSEQMRILLTSGLYDKSEEINIGCLGGEKERDLLQKLIVNQYPKLKIRYYSSEITKYEFETLKLIESSERNYIGFYFHTKAVTNFNDTIQNHWREWLNEAILNRWKEHYLNITRGYDVSSVNHCTPPLHPEHFSGNFWWFSRGYVNSLPKIDKLDKSNRWQAEQWICSGHGKFYATEFVEPGRDVFVMRRDNEEE